ncbi:hypothetical protein AOLI_G00137010 [Acnodon oligacanthus]
MNTVLAGLTYKICTVYLDDTVEASPKFKQHLKELSEVLTRFQSAGLSLKLSKCQFCLSDLVFLSYLVTPDGILSDQSKVSTIMDFKAPKNVKERDQDARDFAVAFASRTLYKAEKPYSTPEKVCLVVIWALEHFRPYVEGLHVTVFTDQSSHRWLKSRPNPSGRLARWSLRLQDFDFHIIHKPRVQNKVPGALSRNPLPGNDATLNILPDYATIAGLDLRALPPVLLQERSHVRQLQLNDHETGTLLRDLENTPEGGTNELDACYIEQDGLLYFLDPKSCCGLHPLKQFKLYAPMDMRGTLLRYYHDHPTAGHLGVTKTLTRLRLRFFWPKMASDVKKYVLSCSVCQLTKPSQRKSAGLMVPINPERPWEYVGVDFVGPLPHTSCGNAHIIVFD